VDEEPGRPPVAVRSTVSAVAVPEQVPFVQKRYRALPPGVKPTIAPCSVALSLKLEPVTSAPDGAPPVAADTSDVVTVVGALSTVRDSHEPSVDGR